MSLARLREVVHAITVGRSPVKKVDRARTRHWSRLKEQHRAWWEHESVVGVCIARKYRQGKLGPICIQVLVDKKIPLEKVRTERHRVPDFIESPLLRRPAKTDVRAIGRASLESFASAERPTRPGFDVGNQLGRSGTIGCIVRENAGEHRRLGLSCAHVLAPNGSADLGVVANSVILCPSFANAEILDVVGQAQLGKLVAVQAPGFEPQDAASNIDAALFAPDNPDALDSAIARLGVKPVGINDSVKLDMRVQKVGAVSEHTHGVVHAIAVVPKIPYPNGREAVFVDQIGISSFTRPGDSGALVLDEENRAVGLHFGAWEGMSICTPIRRVLLALDCTLE